MIAAMRPQEPTAPVITIDGPTASGKGTVAQRVADALQWSMLDSGVLYRLTALVALERNVSRSDESSLGEIAQSLDVVFDQGLILLSGRDVADAIRAEAVGNAASQIAALPGVRSALLARQRAFQQFPGLVADGRDMGTIVFPNAPLKIFLIADVQARAERRCKQLKGKGISANLTDLLRDLRERDARDMQRTHAPLVAAQDAHTLDSSDLSIEQTTEAILALWRNSSQ